MEAYKRIIFLCGINGTGKSSLAARFQNCGYEVVDVDKSNFDTTKKVEKYYQYFIAFLESQTVGPISFSLFEEKFNALYNGVCNRDASLTILSIYEDLTGRRSEGRERELAVDRLYKYVLAPVYREDTILNISEAIGKNITSMCIDIGSRKFLFVDCDFVKSFIQQGFEVDVVYLDLDIERNTDNLFNIRNDKYVIFDRLNLTGVVSDCLKKHSNLEALSKMLISQDKTIREQAFIDVTKLLEERAELKVEVREKIREYLSVRKETLALQLSELRDDRGGVKQNTHILEIITTDSIGEIFTKIETSMKNRRQTESLSPVEMFAAVNKIAPRGIVVESVNAQVQAVVGSQTFAELSSRPENQAPAYVCHI